MAVANKLLDVELQMDGVQRRFRQFRQFGELLGRHQELSEGDKTIAKILSYPQIPPNFSSTENEQENDAGNALRTRSCARFRTLA